MESFCFICFINLFSDIERAPLFADCFMGSNNTECEQLHQTLVTMAMNATHMLAQQSKWKFLCVPCIIDTCEIAKV